MVCCSSLASHCLAEERLWGKIRLGEDPESLTRVSLQPALPWKSRTASVSATRFEHCFEHDLVACTDRKFVICCVYSPYRLIDHGKEKLIYLRQLNILMDLLLVVWNWVRVGILPSFISFYLPVSFTFFSVINFYYICPLEDLIQKVLM